MSLPLPYKPTGAQSQTTGASFETECSVITADTSTYIMTMTNIQAIPMSGNSTILHLITRKSDLANRGDRGLIDTFQQQTTTGSKKCGANCSLLQLAALTFSASLTIPMTRQASRASMLSFSYARDNFLAHGRHPSSQAPSKSSNDCND